MSIKLTALESFRYRGVIAGKGEAVTEAQLAAAYNGVVEAFGKLRDLLAE